jgi:hypothetical protein
MDLTHFIVLVGLGGCFGLAIHVSVDLFRLGSIAHAAMGPTFIL